MAQQRTQQAAALKGQLGEASSYTRHRSLQPVWAKTSILLTRTENAACPPASPIPWSQQPQSAVPAAFLHSIRAILMLSVQAVVSPAVQFPRTTVKTCWWLRETRLDSAGFKTTPRAAQILTGGSGSPTMIPDQRARTRRERRRRPGPGQPTSQAEGVGLGLREQLR